MATLAELDRTSTWVAHEARVLARAMGWLCKRCGVESLFDDRKGALEVITREFGPEHLALRSWPDMILRSRLGTYLVEAKAADSRTPNLAIEAYQYLFLCNWAALGIETWYCFGAPVRDELASRMVLASELQPFRADIPARVARTWPEELYAHLVNGLEAMSLSELRRNTATNGSGDPYLLIPKTSLASCPTLQSWLTERTADPPFGLKERIAWEGRDDAKRDWPHIPYSRWRRK